MAADELLTGYRMAGVQTSIYPVQRKEAVCSVNGEFERGRGKASISSLWPDGHFGR